MNFEKVVMFYRRNRGEVCLASLAVVLITAGAIVFLLRSGKTPPPLPPLDKAQVYHGFSAAYRSLNDIFARAQRERIRDNTDIIASVEDLRRYEDLSFSNEGHLEYGIYSVLFDFTTEIEDKTRLLPPIVAVPAHPDVFATTNAIFPVLLLRPEDNPPNAMTPKVRLHMLTGEEITTLVNAKRLYDIIRTNYQFVSIHEPKFWPYYSQLAIREYFSEQD
jgi:hypothetical protein